MTKVSKVGKVVRKRDEKHNGTDVKITNSNGKIFSFFQYDDGRILIYAIAGLETVQMGFSKYEIIPNESDNPKCEGWSRPTIIIKE